MTQQPWEFFYSIDQIFSFLPEHTNILSSSTRRNKNFHWVKQKKLNEGENLSHILCRFCGGLFWFLGQCSCCRHKVKGYQEICCDKKLYFKFFPCKNTAIGTFFQGPMEWLYLESIRWKVNYQEISRQEQQVSLPTTDVQYIVTMIQYCSYIHNIVATSTIS